MPKAGLFPVDLNGVKVPTWGEFVVDKHTITDDDTLEEITIPSKAYEVVLRSDSLFKVSNASDGEEFETAEIQLGVGRMDSLWVSGAASQVIEIIWGEL